MTVKKKILRQSYDYAAEKAYYREARICPECGADEQISSLIEGLFIERRQYTCLNCGCKWKVKLYHEKKARSEA